MRVDEKNHVVWMFFLFIFLWLSLWEFLQRKTSWRLTAGAKFRCWQPKILVGDWNACLRRRFFVFFNLIYLFLSLSELSRLKQVWRFTAGAKSAGPSRSNKLVKRKRTNTNISRTKLENQLCDAKSYCQLFSKFSFIKIRKKQFARRTF